MPTLSLSNHLNRMIPHCAALLLIICTALGSLTAAEQKQKKKNQQKVEQAESASDEISPWTYQFRLPDSLWEKWSELHKRVKRAAKKPGDH